MHYNFSVELRLIQEAAEKYAKKKIEPIHEEDEAEGRFRREIVEEMGQLGFWGAIIPEEYDGTNSGFVSAVLITEALSKVSLAYAGHFLTQTAGTGWAILKHGTKEQKKTYLPPLVTADILGCFAVTEPDTGSDLLSMQMSAREASDGFILNGTKTWITNAPEADVGLIFAVTDEQKKHEGISCFIMNLKDNPAIKITLIDKLGQRCTKVGEINFSDVWIPNEAMIGAAGQGYRILRGMLNTTRLFAAARALGLQNACIDKSVAYAKTRVQFGKPIGAFQLIQEQIAEMYVNYEASRVLVYNAAALKDEGAEDKLAVAAAKLFACESALKAADSAMKIYGAYGYAMEYPIQRYLRDSRALVITEGSSNIQKVIIAKDLLKL